MKYYRGLLTEIMGTPYEKRDEWLIDVVRWKGTLYLMKVTFLYVKIKG